MIGQKGELQIMNIIMLANSLVIIGTVILAFSLIPIRQLVSDLPLERGRRRWYFLATMILLFIIGYLCYAGFYWTHHQNLSDLIVPGVFFFGACYVLLTTNLALQTAMDVRRLTQLEQEIVTDTLTGLYNRRYLNFRLEEEIDRAQRYALPLSVLLLDIDHFKRINDTYGHQVGDLLLSFFGKQVLNSIRTSDIATRYGGEEFLIIAPHTPINTAGMVAERLRREVESNSLVLTCNPTQRHEVQSTVSIGVACLNQETDDLKKLIKQADEALYRAKNKGRNLVEVCSGMTSSNYTLKPFSPDNTSGLLVKQPVTG